MMKTKIVAVGNQENFNYIIVNKNKTFFEWLAKLLWDSFEIGDVEIYESYTKNKKLTTRKKQIKNYIDIHESYDNGNINLNVFYGKDKVFITFNASLEQRRRFIKNLDKSSNWAKKIRNKEIFNYTHH